jgi:hypothetical protein
MREVTLPSKKRKNKTEEERRLNSPFDPLELPL